MANEKATTATGVLCTNQNEPNKKTGSNNPTEVRLSRIKGETASTRASLVFKPANSDILNHTRIHSLLESVTHITIVLLTTTIFARSFSSTLC